MLQFRLLVPIACLICTLQFMSSFQLKRSATNPNIGHRHCMKVYSTSSLMHSATTSQLLSEQSHQIDVPMKGIIDYIGRTSQPSHDVEDMTSNLDFYHPPSLLKQIWTRFALWRQFPWKKIGGKVVLTAKIGGNMPLESNQQTSFFSQSDPEEVSSVQDVDKLFTYAAYDPRVQALILDISMLGCGYAKITEIRRRIEFFKKSGKPVIAYCASGCEKEFYLCLSCDEVYVPPEGGFDLRGFSASATFARGALDRVGIEPQFECIGKYKSFGDTVNRFNISDSQREVVSSLLMEASTAWVSAVAKKFNKSEADILQLWASKTIIRQEDLRDIGLVSGIMYQDQVYDKVKQQFQLYSWFGKVVMKLWGVTDDDLIKKHQDFDLDGYMQQQPRRQLSPPAMEASNAIAIDESKVVDDAKSHKVIVDWINKLNNKPSLYPAGRYLKKIRGGDHILKGLPYKNVRRGSRIAVINAVGSINSGKSQSGNNPSIGSDTLIEMVREARDDDDIKGVIIRVNSPGGSALASYLMWREIKELAAVKPVVASQIDVAASGGYCISMACDQIVAEELSIIGSIGIVLGKYNAQELIKKLGFNVETISRGRYAELQGISRGFTSEEDEYFRSRAAHSYKEFVSKAAASRGMSYEAMNEVAQGRVWTGRQAKEIGLVDHIGGFSTAVKVLQQLCNMTEAVDESMQIRLEVMEESNKGLLSSFVGSSSAVTSSLRTAPQVMATCDSSVFDAGLISPESVGCGSDVLSRYGIPSAIRFEMGFLRDGTVLLQLLTDKLDGLLSAPSVISRILNAVESIV